MPWNTSAILLKGQVDGKPEEVFELLGFPGGRFVRAVTLDQAGSHRLPGRAFALIDDWTVLFDPEGFGLLDDAPAADGFFPPELEAQLGALSQQAEVFAFRLAEASGTAAFSRFVGGARTRCLVKQAGVATLDLGTPDEIEAAVMAEQADPENAVLVLAERLGFDLLGQKTAEYSLFTFPR
jgi:hypothetical protein